MKVIFLDYDGVVNTIMFDLENPERNKGKPRYNWPDDGKVNNPQAVKWIEMLCKETGAKLVISSTWRSSPNYKECLYNAGLSPDIEILGKTPRLHIRRGLEIQKWLDENGQDVTNFIIIDDDSDMEHLMDRLIQTNMDYGFMYPEYRKALAKLTEGDVVEDVSKEGNHGTLRQVQMQDEA